MERRKNEGQKDLAWLLSVCLVAGSFGQFAFAAEDTEQPNEKETSVDLPTENKEEVGEQPVADREENTEAPDTPVIPEIGKDAQVDNQITGTTETTMGDTAQESGVSVRKNLQAPEFGKWVSLNGQTFTNSTNLQINSEKVLIYKKNNFGDIRVMNTDSVKHADGSAEVIFKLSTDNPEENGRFGIIFRASEENYAMVNFGRNKDGQGEWVLESKNGWKDLFGPQMALGEYNKLAVVYVGTTVKVYLNDRRIFDLDTQVLNGPSDYPMGEGHVGFRDYWYPKTVEIASFIAGDQDEVQILDMTAYDAKLLQAHGAVESPRYLHDSKADLIALLENLPNFYVSADKVEEAILKLEEAMAKLQEKPQVSRETLQNEYMEVQVGKAFPQVYSYKMKQLSDKIMYGQRQDLETIVINGRTIKPQVTSQKVDDTKMEYTLLCENGEIQCELKAEVRLEGENLIWAVTEVKNNHSETDTDEKLVRTIEVPNLSIVSVNSGEQDAALHGGQVHVTTVNIQQNGRIRAGDMEVPLNAATNFTSAGFYIATIYNNQLAASVYTNSDNSGMYGDWNFTKASLQREEDGSKSIGLTSIPWVYQRGLEYRVQNEEINGETELPFLRVRIVGMPMKTAK
ncbi:MAG: hypothetical protein Q4A29_05800 [Eubacteriales bacterium]|nr:hypothetical protein [Eubacteriales bacterium]